MTHNIQVRVIIVGGWLGEIVSGNPIHIMLDCIYTSTHTGIFIYYTCILCTNTMYIQLYIHVHDM